MKDTTEDDQQRKLSNPERWKSELQKLNWYSDIPEDHAFVFIARPLVGFFTAVLLGGSLLATCAMVVIGLLSPKPPPGGIHSLSGSSVSINMRDRL